MDAMMSIGMAARRKTLFGMVLTREWKSHRLADGKHGLSPNSFECKCDDNEGRRPGNQVSLPMLVWDRAQKAWFRQRASVPCHLSSQHLKISTASLEIAALPQ